MTRNRDDFTLFEALRAGAVGLFAILAIMIALGAVIEEGKEEAAMKSNAQAVGGVDFTTGTASRVANTGLRPAI